MIPSILIATSVIAILCIVALTQAINNLRITISARKELGSMIFSENVHLHTKIGELEVKLARLDK